MKVILVSHGSFSKGLFETMEMVLGEQQNLSYVSSSGSGYPERKY